MTARGRGGGAVGVEGTRSRRAATGVTRRDGAQPQRSSGGVPRGPLDPHRATAPAPRRLPGTGFAVLQNPDVLEIEIETSGFGDKTLGRLLQGFLGEVERAPVDRDEALTVHVGECPEGLLGRRVACVHDDRSYVGADWYRRQVERTQALADLREPGEVRGVAGEVEPLGLPSDDPTAPEAAVTVP